MRKSFLEYFCCPAAFATFRLRGEPSSQPGFFAFGRELIGYGRLVDGQTTPEPTQDLTDARELMRIERQVCVLPFDPDEIVNNLRYERYRDATPRTAPNSESFVHSTYYAVRPLLPVSLRKYLQRAALRGWERTPFPRWPVDYSVDSFLNEMMSAVLQAHSVERIPFIWFWPDGLQAAAIMTHDVETALGRDFCATLMDMDDSFGIKSSFQVVPERRYEVPKTFLSSLRERGFEINVHDINHDGHLFLEREEFLRRVARINAYGKQFGAIGYRSAVLYRNLDWYDSFDYAYDMSVPNVGHLEPQPGGCCTTKPFFIGKILELPVMATQDYSLFHILRSYSADLWSHQIQTVLGQNGLLSFIVHPDYLLEERSRRTYRALLVQLAHLRDTGVVWTALPADVNHWWRNRQRMRLVQKKGYWEVEGPDSDRARVAYASLENGRLHFTLDPAPSAAAGARPPVRNPLPPQSTTAPMASAD